MNAITMLSRAERKSAMAGATFDRNNRLDNAVETRAPSASPADAIGKVEAAARAFSPA
jgi:hypothetical protein